MNDRRLRDDLVRDMAIRYGAPANPIYFAKDGDAAQALAEKIGRPVAIKLVADEVVHKSKAGGVLLGVAAPDVSGAVTDLFARQRNRGVSPTGVTIEAMVEAGLEVVVGALQDQAFGPIVMFGAGGVDVEILADVAFALAPVSAEQAYRLMQETRVGRVVTSRLPARSAELVKFITSVAGEGGLLFAEEVDQVDFNPIMVSEHAVVAVDARAVEAAAAAEIQLPDPKQALAALEPAIYPRSVAILGASASPQKMGHRALRNLTEFGYEGHVYPVSRSADSICGVPTTSSVHDLPEGIDRAVIALPASAVAETLEALARRGTRTAHVYTAETPPFPAAAGNAGMRILGPNCIGSYSPYVGMTMISPEASSHERGGVAFVSQSGTYAGDVVRRGAQIGINFSFVSSVGNCEDVQPSELLAFCDADPRTRVAAFYLEDDRDASSFFRYATTMSKPVVLFKGGRSAAGGMAAASHTGALASDPKLFRDIAENAGAILVNDLDELLDTLLILQDIQTLDGTSIGLVGSGGGVAVVGTDFASDWDLDMPTLGQDATNRLERFAAPGVSLNNPVDIPIWSLFDNEGPFTGSVVSAVANDPAIDYVIAYLDLGTVYDMMPAGEASDIVRTLTRDILGARGAKPYVLVLRSGGSSQQDEIFRELRAESRSAGVPVFGSVARAIRAIGRARRSVLKFRDQGTSQEG